MPLVYWIIFIFICFINLISVIICILDKHRAVKKGRRIRERTLILLCIFGGSPFMYATMIFIRHKTRHIKFMLGIPLIFAIQFTLALFFISKYLTI
ncbi:MAG: DUF1294 domain-containing protein [Ruminococcaceae bacterium]|nr:DUF1294 domain-containing protein [Oscillospiraceae bacterium]